MAMEGAEVGTGFPLAEDEFDGATVPELLREFQGLDKDARWRLMCALAADLTEHPGGDDDRSARVITDAYLEVMAWLDSVVNLLYTRPISRNAGEPLILGAADHLSVCSNVEKTDPRINAISLAIRQADETEKSAHRTM